MPAIQYLFYIHIDEDDEFHEGPSFCIVEENFWDENKYLDDQELGDLDGLLNERWREDQEAIYSYWDEAIDDIAADPNEGKQALLDLGFKEIPDSEWSDSAHPL